MNLDPVRTTRAISYCIGTTRSAKRTALARWRKIDHTVTRVPIRSLSTWAPPQRFLSACKVNSNVEQERVLISQEEQELLLSAPTCSARHHTTKDLADDPVSAAEVIVDEGLLRVDGLLSVEEAGLLKGHIENVLEQSIDAVAHHGMEYMNLFGPVLCRRHRYHVLLPFDETVLRIVRNVFDRAAGVLEVVGDDSYLCELGGLVSDPGSPAQPVHHDTTFDGSSPRVTILIALQDVTPQMGPTYIFPETNTPDWHVNLEERGDMFEHLLEDTPHVLGVMSAGDAIMYDTRVLHCGGANSSHLASISDRDDHPAGNADGAVAAHFDKGTRRTLLALSVQEEDGANRLGHTHIRPGYRGKFRVSDYRAWVATE